MCKCKQNTSLLSGRVCLVGGEDMQTSKFITETLSSSEVSGRGKCFHNLDSSKGLLRHREGLINTEEAQKRKEEVSVDGQT